jgi:methionyl-tRNA synthetase
MLKLKSFTKKTPKFSLPLKSTTGVQTKLFIRPITKQQIRYFTTEKQNENKDQKMEEKIFEENLNEDVPVEKGFWTTLFSLWGNLVIRYAMIAGISIIVIYTGWSVWSFFTNL